MQFGCTLSLEDISKKGLVGGLLRLGYDYAELPARAVAGLDAAAFSALRAEVAALGVSVPAMNVLLPNEVKVTGKSADLRALGDYAGAVFERCQALGCRLMVFGSGGARALEAGFPAESAKAQMTEALALLSELAGPYDVRIALEPLNSKECNFINSLAEAMELVNAVRRANVGVTADFYHMSMDAEPVGESLRACGKAVFHTHFADPDGRFYPVATKPGFRPFFDGLRAIGYDGRLSIEAGTKDILADAAKSLEVLKSL